MGSNRLELVIFDCDGVLVDSEPIVNRIFAETLTEAGFQITHAEVSQQFVGKSLATCLQAIEQTFGRPVPASYLERSRERTIATLERELQATPGIATALEQLTLPKCVASNSSPRHVQHVLQLTGLIDHFHGKLYSAHYVDRPKPFPDVYLHAARDMGVDPKYCVVIEDSIPGVQAGYAAGMRVLGYAPSNSSDYHNALVAAGAQLVFADMQQLPTLLQEI